MNVSIQKWTPTLLEIKDFLETKFKEHLLLSDIWQSLNCVLVNQYQDGSDSMGYHSDDEYILTGEKIILSLSLGKVQFIQ